MVTNLREKTFTGIVWSFLEFFLKYMFDFIIGIILARLLSPKEFGLVGIVFVFTALSRTFVEGGFKQALIRKKNCSEEDYCTVFIINLGVSLLVYLVFFFSADSISRYFNEPLVSPLLRVGCISIIIFAFLIVPESQIIKQIKFKKLTLRTTFSSVSGGLVGIVLAVLGFGVWSLIAKTIVQNSVMLITIWKLNNWKPKLSFSVSSFKEMFGFGSKLLITSFLHRFYENIHQIVIAKYFSPTVLGFYTKSSRFGDLFSNNFNLAIQRVSYPVLSSVQDNEAKLNSAFKKTILSVMFINLSLMLILAASAEAVIVFLLGENWKPAVPILQLLCLSKAIHPLNSMNANIFKVKGRSDLFLKVDFLNKGFSSLMILFGVYFKNINILLLGMVLSEIVAFLITSIYNSNLITFSLSEQIRNIAPFLIISVSVSLPIYLLGQLLVTHKVSYIYVLGIQFGLGIFSIIMISELAKLREYIFLKDTLLSRYHKISNATT